MVMEVVGGKISAKSQAGSSQIEGFGGTAGGSQPRRGCGAKGILLVNMYLSLFWFGRQLIKALSLKHLDGLVDGLFSKGSPTHARASALYTCLTPAQDAPTHLYRETDQDIMVEQIIDRPWFQAKSQV